KVGDETVHVLHTPGHSPGSISLAGDGYVLTGDALFNQSIGRTDLPGGNLDTLIHSIRAACSSWTMTQQSILAMDLRPLSAMRSSQIPSWEGLQGLSNRQPSYPTTVSQNRNSIVQPRLDPQELSKPGQLSHQGSL